MTALVSFLIFILIVALVAVLVRWIANTCLAMIGVPANVLTICDMIIVLVALLVILERAWPLIGHYT